jgi:hypothetical protein
VVTGMPLEHPDTSSNKSVQVMLSPFQLIWADYDKYTGCFLRHDEPGVTFL